MLRRERDMLIRPREVTVEEPSVGVIQGPWRGKNTGAVALNFDSNSK